MIIFKAGNLNPKNQTYQLTLSKEEYLIIQESIITASKTIELFHQDNKSCNILEQLSAQMEAML